MDYAFLQCMCARAHFCLKYKNSVNGRYSTEFTKIRYFVDGKNQHHQICDHKQRQLLWSMVVVHQASELCTVIRFTSM